MRLRLINITHPWPASGCSPQNPTPSWGCAQAALSGGQESSPTCIHSCRGRRVKSSPLMSLVRLTRGSGHAGATRTLPSKTCHLSTRLCLCLKNSHTSPHPSSRPLEPFCLLPAAGTSSSSSHGEVLATSVLCPLRSMGHCPGGKVLLQVLAPAPRLSFLAGFLRAHKLPFSLSICSILT